MKCPQCGKVYTLDDFDRDDVYFECSHCEVELEGIPRERRIPQPSSDSQGSYMASGPYYAPAPPTSAYLAPTTPEQFARTYDSSIVVNRWFGTVIDYVTIVVMILAADLILGNALYRATLVIWLGLAVAYFPVMEGYLGYTVGKLIAGTRVVDANGDIPGLKKAAIRTFFRVVEINPALLGGLPAGIIVLVSKTRQRLGDMVAGTYVLRRKDANEVQARRLTAAPN